MYNYQGLFTQKAHIWFLNTALEQKPSFKGIGRVVYQVSPCQEDAGKIFKAIQYLYFDVYFYINPFGQ